VVQGTRTSELTVTCDCGFEACGTGEELILIVQEHGIEAHNVNMAFEHVLAMVRPAPLEATGWLRRAVPPSAR
jgi:predicted small metal-binding protein